MVVVILLIVIQLVLIFLSVGVVTVVERKVLSFVQGREGPCQGLKGIVVFILDYFKLVFKFGSFGGLFFSSMFCIFLLFCMVGLTPLSLLGFKGSFYNVLFVLILDVILVGVKYVVSDSYVSKMVEESSYRLRLSVLVVELMFFFLIFPVVFSFLYLGASGWLEASCKVSFFFIFLEFFLFLLGLSLSLFQVSRTPFDYFEGESEMVGGVLSHVGGGHFIIWSFVEYLEIYFKSLLLVSVFFPFIIKYSFVFSILVIFLVLFFVLIRGLLPRLDYRSSIVYWVGGGFVVVFVLLLDFMFVLLRLVF
uniref:NADH dehydrogenase subunit 1 n=1 Tax=Sphaeromyxa zaharoni TaxID=275449 RepID=UPI00300285A1